MKIVYSSTSYKKKQQVALTNRWSNPKQREYLINAQRASYTPEVRAERSAAQKARRERERSERLANGSLAL